MDAAVDPLAGLGWDESFAGSFHAHDALGRVPGRVVAVHKETSIVRTRGGDRAAAVSGRFRYEALSPAAYPAVGDWVALDPEPEPGGAEAVIAAVLPRRSVFRRSASDASRRGGGRAGDEQVLAANIDVALLVAGLDRDFSVRRMERYLAVAWSSEVTPVVVLNKADVADDLAARRVAVEAIAPGVPIVALSALTHDGLAALDPHLRPGSTAVVLGSSGVGKSTLVNALLGEQRQATGAVRAADSRGRHTTTHRELFRLASGALVIDTPGIRSLEVAGADAGVESAFDDVAAVAERCRFADCRHAGEPGCAVRAAIDAGELDEARLESHRKLERELAHAVRRSDPVARLAERKRWRAIQRSVGRHMEHKYGDEQ